MKQPAPGRRGLLLAAPACLLVRPGLAQPAWPSRAISMVTGYAPGGLTDVTTRAIARRMEQELGQPVVVENRVGGATSVAATHVANAMADGHTLLMGASSLAINPALQPELTPREPMRELLPLGLAYRTAFVLHVHPSLPVTSVPELIAYARANPGQLNFGSSGTGAVNHLALELLRQQAGIDVLHVPYRGGVPALTDLRSNRIQAMFQAALEAQPVVKEGITRAIAVSSRDRMPLFPDVPPVSDTLPGFEAVFWQGLFAPPALPAPISRRLTEVLRIATEDAELRDRMAAQGVSIETGDGETMRRILAEDTRQWSELIRRGNIRPE